MRAILLPSPCPFLATFSFSFLSADCRFLSPLHWTPPSIYLSLLLPGLTVVCTSLPATSWPLGSRSSSSSKGACTVLRRTSRPEPPLRGAWAPAVHAKWARREQHCSQRGPSDQGGGGVTARRKTARMAYRAGRSVKICLWRFFFFFSPLPLFFPYEPLDFSPFSRRAQTPFVRYSVSPSTRAPLILPFALLFFFVHPPPSLFWAAEQQQHATLCLPASLFLDDEDR